MKIKLRAFTLIEIIVVITVLGILATAILINLKPQNLSNEALQKGGRNAYIQIEFATKNILAKYTSNYTLLKMKDSSGEFSIANSGSLARTVELYKEALVGRRTASTTATYLSAKLTNGSTTYDALTAGGYSGFTIKNGAYFGLKLHGNCTTTTNPIYDPFIPEASTKANTCGAIFFDVNGADGPNTLGIDQYIIGVGKYGVK